MTHSPTRVLITVELEGLREAAERVPGIQVAMAPGRDEILRRLPEAEVLCLAKFDAEMLRRATRLKWVHAMLGGVEAVLFDEFVGSPIPLTCVKECFAAPGAEHAMASMLAVTSRLNNYAWQRRRRVLEWRLPSELGSRTVGVIGFGNIGRALAQRVKAFGGRVLALARTPHADPGPADEILLPDQLPRLLGESDFVVVAVPLTGGTRGLIDEPQLRAMKRSAWLIDISGRPAIVSQPAVFRALREGWIAGADLQFASAPLADSALWETENLIMSQYSANSQEESRRCLDLFAENLRRFRAGDPLIGLVDKAAGY